MDDDVAPSTGSPLEGSRARCGPDRPAVRHAARLLGLLGASVEADDTIDGLAWAGAPPIGADVATHDETADWARSGAMALTGGSDGPPLVAPGAPASAARGAALAIEALTAAGPSMTTVAVDGGQLLGERAALSGLRRRGPLSPGGSCRLVPTADGLLAVNLARPDDVEVLGAWLQEDIGADPWPAVVAACAARSGGALADRAQLVGIPVAVVPQPREVADDEQSRHRRQRFPLDPWRVTHERSGARRHEPGLVVDLSSMWAGPLCAHLLGLAGFGVVKVESRARPDGARGGPPAFYSLLHCGHRSVAFDFGDESDLARLGSLLESADVVVESSRPRALDHLGVGPAVTLARSPGTVWVSITGYGRAGPWRNRVAFGDDAAAAAGLIVSGDSGAPMFCGDAIADPLTGLHAALAALAMRHGGHGGLVDVALRDVVGSALAGTPTRPEVSVAARSVGGAWVLDTSEGAVSVAEATARPATGRAAPSGADTDDVIRTLLNG